MPLIIPKKRAAAPAPSAPKNFDMAAHERELWEQRDYRTWKDRFPDTPWPGSIVRFSYYDGGGR